MPTLYIVATPIGNLEDISLRALRILREVGLIAAEDTRKTRRLLTAYEIKTPMTSYHEHNRFSKLEYILNRLTDMDIALVSNAGMPGISDPGYELVVAAIQRGITVIPIPGPSIVTAALVVSGLSTEKFSYIGFLPHDSGNRRRALQSVVDKDETLIILESPHRLLAALNDMLDILGDRNIAVCRELTKIHEETFRGRISQAIEYFSEPKGEFTLVVEGKQEKVKPQLTEDTIRHLHQMRQAGVTAKEAIAVVTAETGLSKKELYKAWLKPL